MSNSYRIRTTPGVDKSIKVRIDQDFEYLEILSLKLLQNEIYTRKCSDYGVIVGRVSINNGFGVPNAKVSIFIPLSSEDEANNPILSDLYPYKTLSQVNDIGYRYNLLPSEQSYSNHVPTGSFFTKNDVLTNSTKIEIYDKYFKYNAMTNESGDYMIFGVPVGSQTIVVNVDLSDIGEFSLSPQDMIRMGAATSAQVNGTKFKSSSNLNELPQIITINRTLEVEPLWGDESTCSLGITRTDFDLSAEKNITIQPTSIFMGSMISSNDDQSLKRKCKPSLKSGQLCSLISGPGQIQAIRQTINTDTKGRPSLEVADFEEGGQVIDDNGTWMFDVPMNLDYVVTNEFGEQVISKDPKKGIPTKGKYRFKIMWNQSTDLGERVKRANFLVPNIKEYGWATADGIDPLTGKKVNDPTPNTFGNGDNPCTYSSTVPTTNNGRAAKASYAFSLDWDDYGEQDSSGVLTTTGENMVLEGINCQDRFYEMQYNKVYTVSQLISEYRKGGVNNRIIAIKNILDDACESTNNKFPTNDGLYRFDIMFILFQFLMLISFPLLYFVVFLSHLFFWILCNIIKPIVTVLRDSICGMSKKSLLKFLKPTCKKLDGTVKSMEDKCQNTFLNLPNITYPDCDLCSCDPQEPIPGKSETGSSLDESQTSNSSFGDILNYGSFQGPYSNANPSTWLGSNTGVFSKNATSDFSIITGVEEQDPLSFNTKGTPTDIRVDSQPDNPFADRTFSTDLPWHERFNLFNTKAKYFDNNKLKNPGGGVNRIAVRFNAEINGGPLPKTTNTVLTNSGRYHLDNVIAVLIDGGDSVKFLAGGLLTMIDPTLTGDVNLSNVFPANDFGTNSILGKNIGTPYNGDPKVNFVKRVVTYANPDGSDANNPSVTYDITGSSETTFHKYPMDLEYYQVIENVSVLEYFKTADLLSPDLPNSFYTRVLNGGYRIINSDGGINPKIRDIVGSGINNLGTPGPIREYYTNSNDLRVVFMVRGVDPNSPLCDISYDLSRLYGKKDYGYVVRDLKNVRMNIPVQGGFKCVRHYLANNDSKDNITNLPLFHDSYMWEPSTTFPGVPAGIDPSTQKTYNPLTADPNYRPVGWGTFKPFTTLNHFYYSMVNEFGAWGLNNLIHPGSSVEYVKESNGLLRVNTSTYKFEQDGHTNGYGLYFKVGSSPFKFETEFNDPDDDNGTNTQNIQDKHNRGYFNNEILDGGNVALLRGAEYSPPNELDGHDTIQTSYYVSYTYKSMGGVNYKPMTISLDTNKRKIVMRSDGLPSSSSEELGPEQISFPEFKVSYTLMANNNFGFFIFGEDGGVTPLTTVSSVDGVGGSVDSQLSNAENACGGDLLSTFSCESLVPLRCYYFDTKNKRMSFHEKPSPMSNTGPGNCYSNGQDGFSSGVRQPMSILEGGCYKLVTVPFKTLDLDIRIILPEWRARTLVSFAACRNVFSHYFTNNWINGTLYAFSFINSRRFTPPNTTPVKDANQPYNCYCKTNIFLNKDSNNFYYRVTPYNSTNNSYVGRLNPTNWLTTKSFGGNQTNLMYPTTVMDLGPRDIYTQEIVFSNDYDGYVMKGLSSSSFQDVSDLLNTFIISRLTNRSFLNKLISFPSITKFFSRENLKIDGDYAQLASINSEIGAIGFSDENYDSCDLFYNGGTVDNGVFGVYFSSDTQIRDYLTPKRNIINEDGPITLTNCAFESIKVNTQVVPFYQWFIKPNTGVDKDYVSGESLYGKGPTDSIFGSQFNDWFTKPYSGTTFFSYGYQNLDRLLRSSRYFRTNGSSITKYYRGNIYSVDNKLIQSADLQYWDKNSAPDSSKVPQAERVINTGAPYHFYFGLGVGKSAFDRFTKKWIDTEVTTD